jgi:hypothetical protein
MVWEEPRLKMTIYDIPNKTTGIDDAIIQVAGSVPSFVPSFLFFIFFVVFLGGMATQKKRVGYSDAPVWSLIASIFTFMATLILSLADGLMNLETFSFVVGITILSAVWFFMSKGRGEA